MASPKYRPRDYSDEPKGFGYFAKMGWKKVPAIVDAGHSEEGLKQRRQAAELVASQMQHRYAIRIRARLRTRDPERPQSIKEFAALANMRPDRVSKMLRGVVVMRLDDIAIADVLLGKVGEFAQDSPASSASYPGDGDARE